MEVGARWVMAGLADKERVRTVEQSARRHTAWVLGVALAARVWVAWIVVARMPGGWLWTRGTEMGYMAAALLAGRGWSDPYGVTTGPTTAVGPGYPLLLAGVFRVFGVRTVASAVAVLGLQIGVALVTIWLLLRVARRFARESVAVGLVLAWSLSPATMWMPAILWDTSLSALFLLVGVLWAMRLEAAGSGDWLGYGAGCAVAGLVNPSLLPSLLGMGGVAAWRGRRVAGAVLGCVVFAGVYGTWPMRNARVFHAVVLTRAVAGYNLWVGNRAGAAGYLDETAFPTANAGELARYRVRGEVGYDAEKMRLAKQAIATEPGRFARLTMLRTWRFWSGTGNRNGSVFFGLHGVMTMLLGGLGMWLLLRHRRREAMYFLAALAMFPLPYLITHAEFRYRLVIDPVLCVLGAIWLNWMFSRRERSSGA